MAAISLRRGFPWLASRPQILRPLLCTGLSRSRSSSEQVTHTGQVFAEQDFRKARFTDREKLGLSHVFFTMARLASAFKFILMQMFNKEVNQNFGETLISEEAPIEVDARVVSCNGGGGALGHPKVYINLDQPGPRPCVTVD